MGYFIASQMLILSQPNSNNQLVLKKLVKFFLSHALKRKEKNLSTSLMTIHFSFETCM